jgi:hypothetical protein
MLVETRLEDQRAPAPPAAATEGAGIDAVGDAAGDAAGPALRDLIAAGLVSHEAIGDPARLSGGETAALAAICRQVAGPVYRLAPFHYAFASGAPTEALAAALAAELGPEALWLGATALLGAPPGDVSGDASGDAPGIAPGIAPDAALLLLHARGAATAAGLAAAGPGVQAVIDAAYAVDCARLAAGADPGGPLARRLAALEARLETGLETTLGAGLDAGFAALRDALDARAAPAAAAAAAVEAALGPALEAALRPALAELAAATGRAAREAERLAELRDTIAVTLAEFLARLERRAAADAP